MVWHFIVAGQSYNFRHLNTSDGLLSDLRLTMAEDRLGRLWIGSDEGINIFDGYHLSSFTQTDTTESKSNYVQQIYCDRLGTIWIATPAGILYKKENDNLFRHLPADSFPFKEGIFFGETTTGELIITVKSNCYLLKNDATIVKLQGLEKAFTQNQSLTCFEKFDGDLWLMGFRNKLLLVNVKEQTIIKEMPVTVTWCTSKVNDSTIITGSFARDSIQLVNIRTGIAKPINAWLASDGNSIGGYAGTISPIGNNKFAIATRYYGVYIVDLNLKNAVVLKHDPAEPSSLKSVSCRRLFITRSGTMFVASRGLSYTQLNTTQFTGQKYIINNKGEKYDGGFTSVIQDGKNNFWLGTNGFLAKWNRQTNICTYYPYYDLKYGSQKFKTIRAVVSDKLDRIWVGTFGGGIGMLLPSGGYEQFRNDPNDLEHSIPNIDIHSIAKDKDGNFILCTNYGFGLFNPITKKAQTYFKNPVVRDIAKDYTYYAMADAKNNWWLAQVDGLYYWDRQANLLHKIVLPGIQRNKQMQVLATDSVGMVYAGGSDGLYIISPTTLTLQRIVNKKDGLASNNIVGLLCDKMGMMWILGNIGVARYSPKTGILQSFDARDGVEQSNHTLGNFYLAKDGEVFLTSFEGFNYFYPQYIKADKKPLQVFVTTVELKDSIITMPKSTLYDFSYYQNNLSFSYLAVDFKLGTTIQYRYQLNGFDTSFVDAGKQRMARYTNLPAGDYSFVVQVSTNGKDWYSAETSVQFQIRKAFWKTWSFIVVLSALLGAIVFFIFYFRVKKILKEEAVKRDFESKIAQVRMNLLRTQMNPHFLFNSLNSINSFILKNDRQNASGYLTKFSRLMRLILDNSRTEWVTVDSEMKAIELYIQLEALRFNHTFKYHIYTSPELDIENILLPPMLIQPYVENAIWHGLMYRKEPGGLLNITLSSNNGALVVCINDNGVGRDAATALKSKSALQQKSYGMKITEERMGIVNETYKLNARAVVTDLVDEAGNAMGTEVILTVDKVVNRT